MEIFPLVSTIFLILELMVRSAEEKLRDGDKLGEIWTKQGISSREWRSLSFLAGEAINRSSSFFSGALDSQFLDWNTFFSDFVLDRSELRYK